MKMIKHYAAPWFLLVTMAIVLGGCGGGSSSNTSSSTSSALSSLSSDALSSSSATTVPASSSSINSSGANSSVSSQLSSSSLFSSLLSSSLSSSSFSSAVSSAISSSISSSVASSSSQAGNAYVPVSINSEITRVQPMTGIVFWSDNGDALDALEQDIQLEFSYMLYRDVVTTLGTYNWSAVDTKLAQAAARGHQMILRFRDTYPGQTAVSIPNGLPSNFAQVEGQNTFIPDWSSTELHAFILDFFTKFAARYDNDPRLAFLQVGFGSYGEYHLYEGNAVLGQNFPSKSFQTTFLNHIASQFSHTPWSISKDAASSDYTPFSATASLKNLAFGIFDDSFLHETHSEDDDEYNRSSWLFFGTNRYENNPAGGEFSYYSAHDQEHALDINGPHGRSFENLASLYHITYMIGNNQFEYQTRARIKAASMATGYAFRVTKLESNGENVRISISNEGIAPIYYDAYPSVNGQRATQSLKGLLPNNTRDIEITIDEHNPLDLTMEIESDRLVTGQVIQFNADL